MLTDAVMLTDDEAVAVALDLTVPLWTRRKLGATAGALGPSRSMAARELQNRRAMTAGPMFQL
jgi:hypothetical protein